MAGVGFTFIFSWLLMILVVIFFTIGGHSERYLCQNLESPYEGLKFVDSILPSLDLEFGDQPINISLHTTITECEKNASIYNAASIDQIFNITELVDEALAMIDPFREQVNNFTLDLSSIDTYPPELESTLDSIKNSGFSSINFTTYIEQIDRGLTSTNLTEYAVFLNASADNMTTTTPPLPPPSQELLDTADLIRAHSYNITLIQTNMVDPLSTTLSRLNDSVRDLETTAAGFNDTVDSLATALQDLNVDIQNNGSAVVSEVVSEFGNNIIDDAVAFMDYIVVQITERFGACRPIFLVYAKMTAILCGYLVEILNGFWFSLGWCVAFLIPAAILAMKLAKFYRVMSESNDKEDVHWDEMEMESMHNANNNNKRLPSAKLRSTKVHPAPTADHYY